MIITFTTDFGWDSPYVAQMKGVALALNRDLTLVDISHGIAPQTIRQGAFVLDQAVWHFPSRTIHVAVVDPGVGTARSIVYAEMADQRFVAPDNGLLSRAARRHRPQCLVEVTNKSLFRETVSATFHGRDIMAPVAAHLSRGVEPAQLGPATEDLVELAWPEPYHGVRCVRGEVLFVDAFGNLITNILEEDLPGEPAVALHVGGQSGAGARLVRTYAQAEPGTLVGLIGSSGHLEFAVVGGNAGRQLGLDVGTAVDVTW